ncbi:MAG: hypothetical protein AMR96_06340 [Candidatus Adiutrix intracellularis]|nr:MAG: hypothetical protein AMR96_06340 [Candidatus Adiutrix intracellularis]
MDSATIEGYSYGIEVATNTVEQNLVYSKYIIFKTIIIITLINRIVAPLFISVLALLATIRKYST